MLLHSLTCPKESMVAAHLWADRRPPCGYLTAEGGSSYAEQRMRLGNRTATIVMGSSADITACRGKWTPKMSLGCAMWVNAYGMLCTCWCHIAACHAITCCYQYCVHCHSLAASSTQQLHRRHHVGHCTQVYLLMPAAWQLTCSQRQPSASPVLYPTATPHSQQRSPGTQTAAIFR